MISHAEVLTVLPPVVPVTSPGGEVRVGKRVVPTYPEGFKPGKFPFVQIAEMGR